MQEPFALQGEWEAACVRGAFRHEVSPPRPPQIVHTRSAVPYSRALYMHTVKAERTGRLEHSL